MIPGNRHRWSIVLAAGEGRRLSSLTRALHGESLPKQFANIVGGRSLLHATLDRIRPLCPPERTVVVIDARYEAIARSQLAGHAGVDVIVQPRNLDTGPGILLPLSRIRLRDPEATVAIFPCDHWVPRPRPLLELVEREPAALEGAQIVLVGVEPAGPEKEYGWIVPGASVRRSEGVRSVVRFVEKPSMETAMELLQQGALWNTFISTGRVQAFWTEATRYLPLHAELFEWYGRRPHQTRLHEIYAHMPPANFSSSVLQGSRQLGVATCVGSGWCDWGTPERVLNSLAGTEAHAALISRIGGFPLSEPRA